MLNKLIQFSLTQRLLVMLCTCLLYTSREISKAYGAQSLRYKNYQKGLGSYLRQANTVLQTEQGETLNCAFKYRGTSGSGACQSETDHFEFLAIS